MKTRFSMMITGNIPLNLVVPFAQQTEEFGFDQIHVADDLIYRPAWSLLTMIALNTKRIELGPFIVTPQIANPIYHAANLASLQELSGGRTVAGVGRGGLMPLIGGNSTTKPVKMLREAWQLMHRMLNDDRTAFDGEFFTATEDCYFHFPLPEKRVPLYIGTWGVQMARMAGAMAAGIKADCTASPTHIARLRASFMEGAAAAGRDPTGTEIIIGPVTSISEDRVEAENAARNSLALFQPFLAPMTFDAGITKEEIDATYQTFISGDEEKAMKMVSQKAISEFTMTGTPHDVIGQIEAMIDAGADHIAFGASFDADPRRPLRMIGEKILPHFLAKRG